MRMRLRCYRGFSLDELMARELMVPRTDAFMVDIQDDTKEIIESILKQSFSRIPVYDGDKDNVIGLIHTKRLLNEGFVNGFDNIVLRKILQEPLFVPETMFVDDLLKELRNTQNQMAILWMSMAVWLVWLHLRISWRRLLVRSMMRPTRPKLKSMKSVRILLHCLRNYDPNDLNEYFEVEIESDDVDTIAGYYLTGVGTIPDPKERISFEVESQNKKLILTNDKVKNGRVTKVKVEISEQVEADEEVTK